MTSHLPLVGLIDLYLTFYMNLIEKLISYITSGSPNIGKRKKHHAL
jgi:hypothetical protein